MMIEQIKTDPALQPYFLWYLKSNILLPKTNHLLFFHGSGCRNLELVINFEKSLTALIEQLKKAGVDPSDTEGIINEVCTYFMTEIGIRKILDGTPELLIQHNESRN